MKIVVIGGSGLIGSKLVRKLVGHGHQAVPASPHSGVNTLTGEGLAEVLDSADVVVDVSNSPSLEDAAVLKFFQTSTGNLLDAEAAAGVGHHVALSVVGTERLAESGYFRAKTAQEKLIKSSSIKYSQRVALILTRTHQAYTIGRIGFSAKPAVRILRYGSITLKSAVRRTHAWSNMRDPAPLTTDLRASR